MVALSGLSQLTHPLTVCSWQLPGEESRGDVVIPVLPTSLTAPPALNIPSENAGVMEESKGHASGFGRALEEIKVLGGRFALYIFSAKEMQIF